MSRLKLFLLGSLEATLDGAPLQGLRSDRVRALLAYLVAEAGRPHRRETLATLLWGEYPDKAARASLRVSLANLRQRLAPLDAFSVEHPLLLITRQDVQFNADHACCWVDANEFDRCLAACNQHTHPVITRCPACIRRLTKAVELYRDDFLQGLALADSPAFDEWRLFQQESRYQQVLAALSTLTAHHVFEGNYDAAQNYARRQVEIEPWREEAHRQLMQTLALSGQRGAALAQYEACRRILAAELDTEPELETTAIYDQIRLGTIGPEGPPLGQSTATNDGPLPYVMPAQITPLIGRETELVQINDMLENPDCRLITLSGPGGIGKTRLALQVATTQLAAFQDGVYFMPVSTISSAESLLLNLAQTLRFSLYPGEDPLAQFLPYLLEKSMLLILDGFEHLLALPAGRQKGAVELVIGILRHAPNLKVIVVSRERLNVQGEWLLSLEGLSYPRDENVEKIEQFSAVQLFIRSGRRIQPSFSLSIADSSHVVQICRQVEGMPLALELAAAWLRILSCREIAGEIQRNLDFLTTSLRDLPERHRNLRAVFDHSWELLSVEAQNVFRQLSVFQDGFDRAAAEAVAGVTPLVLVSLVDKSLVRRASTWQPESLTRYGMHDLLQRYASDRLAQVPDEQQAVEERHGQYYLRFLQECESGLKGPQQRQALDKIDADIENVRAAWRWAITHGRVGDVEAALESLFLYYYIRSWFKEGEAAFGQLVQSLNQDTPEASGVVLGQGLACQGWFAFQLGHQDQGKVLLQQGLSLLRKFKARAALAFGLNYLGAVVQSLDSQAEARALCLESLAIFREEEDTYGAAIALNILGQAAYQLGEKSEAQELYQESLALHRTIGDQWGIAFSLDYLGRIAYSQGVYKEARRLFQESLSIRREMGDQRGTALCLNCLGDAAEALHEYPVASQLYEEGLLTFKGIGHRAGVTQSLINLGQVARTLRNYEEARRRFAEALDVAVVAQAGPKALEALTSLAMLLVQTGEPVQAFRLVSYVRSQPPWAGRSDDHLDKLYDDLAANLPPEIVDTVRTSGQSVRPEVMVDGILASFD